MRNLIRIFGITLMFGAALPAWNAAALQAETRRATEFPMALVQDLPKEARETLALIKKGGPFPYAKDGAVFSNREKVLAKQKRGYYREYTVKTPHTHNRGARRIIAGGSGEYYYTDDHYASFRRIKE